MNNSPIKIYDARWETGDFSSEEIENLFMSTCVYAKKLNISSIVISHDARLGCPEVVDIAVKTAQESGFDVFLCQEPISTPQSYYNTLRITETRQDTMGWTITASHNPASYIGIKFVVSPVRAIGINSGPFKGLTEIQNIYFEGKAGKYLSKRQKGSLKLINFTEAYIKDSITWAGVSKTDLKGMNVILNPFNGSAGGEVYRTMEALKINVTALNLIVNGNFPNGAPNPTSTGKMDTAVNLAKKKTGSIVIGLDGDGDRIVFGDEKGIFSAGTAMAAILTRLKSLDISTLDKALCDPKINPLSLDLWNSLDYTPVLFRNGHSQIKDYMRTHNIAVAAEESGHYYHRIKRGNTTVFCENSILTILLFLKAIHINPKLLLTMREINSLSHSTGEINYQFPTESKRDRAISLAVSRLIEDNAIISDTTEEGINLEGIAFIKGINPKTKQIENSNWYSGFYRSSTNEKSVARFYICSNSEDILNQFSAQINLICEKELCGLRVE